MTGLNYMSLFAGIGGMDLGLDRAGMHCVAQVEIDPYCRRVLAKHWPNVPRHDDVRTAADWWLSEERPAVDVICGGFPCQDISAAGRRAGIVDGERSSLWAYLADTVRVLRPRYVLVENVSALLVRGLDVVAADLAEIGYDLRWDCVPAAAVGAPHRRDRWFGIAYPQRYGVRLEPVAEPRSGGAALAAFNGQARHVADAAVFAQREPSTAAYAFPVGGHAWPIPRGGSEPEKLAHTEGQRRAAFWPESTRETRPDDFARYAGQRFRGDAWAVEPDVGRVADGVPNRVDRLRALGNAVVPQVAEYVGRLIVAHASGVAA
jgi:DNA (cytosine-5)-methyltransferase 1